MKEALGAQDLDQVYGAVAIKKQLDEKSDYADNSPLMAVNPYAENLILLQYRVQSDEGNAAELAAIYQDYLMYGEYMRRKLMRLALQYVFVEAGKRIVKNLQRM